MSSSSSWCPREIVRVLALTQGRASVHQDALDCELPVVDHQPLPDHSGGHQRDGVGVGLAALAGGEHL